MVVFENVPPGFMTNYNDVEAKNWKFTSKFVTNVTAKSDPTDLDSDSYATVFTCQTAQNKLKNKMVYDSARSLNPKTALLRAINLAQYDYSVDVINRTNDISNVIFNDVSYCTPSQYKSVPGGQYDFGWTVNNNKKRQNEPPTYDNTTSGRFQGGGAYTIWITPSGMMITRDAKKKQVTRSMAERKRSVRTLQVLRNAQ